MSARFLNILVITLIMGPPAFAAAPKKNCEKWVAKSSGQMITGLIQSGLELQTQRILRASMKAIVANWELQQQFRNMSRMLQLQGYRVETTLNSIVVANGQSEVTFTLRGAGRDVAQAVLELSNPDVGGLFAEASLAWMSERAAVEVPQTPASDAVTLPLERRLRLPLRALPLSKPIIQTLIYREHLYFVGDLVHQTAKNLLRNENGIGRLSLQRIEEALAQLDLKLGMVIPGWPYSDLRPLELDLANLFQPPVKVNDWLEYGAANSNLLFEQPGPGPNQEVPIITMTGGIQTQFAIMTEDHFLNRPAHLLARDLREASAQPMPDSEGAILDNWRRDFKQFEVHSVTATFGARGKAFLASLQRRSKPVILVPSMRDASELRSRLILLPLPEPN